MEIQNAVEEVRDRKLMYIVVGVIGTFLVLGGLVGAVFVLWVSNKSLL